MQEPEHKAVMVEAEVVKERDKKDKDEEELAWGGGTDIGGSTGATETGGRQGNSSEGSAG